MVVDLKLSAHILGSIHQF